MDAHLHVYVEAPGNWAAARILHTQLLKLGYRVDHVRKLGHSLLVIK